VLWAIQTDLSENATPLGFASAGAAISLLATPSCLFLGADRPAGAIEADVKLRNR
jgi:hypothetical protein